MKQFKLGLLGEHIAASGSPRLHEQEARAQGLKLSYELFDFAARNLDLADLGKMLNGLQDSGYAGVNITHPFKQAVLEHLHELSDEAMAIGAVNTVIFRKDRKIGFNTDCSGFRLAFREVLPQAKLGKVLLLGAGGAGSAVAEALLSLEVSSLYIHDRDPEKAQLLVDKLNSRYANSTVTFTGQDEIASTDYDGLVNASPVGMQSSPGMPIDKTLVGKHLWLADIIYFPLNTELLRYAESLGCKTMNGARMAVYQAADAFQLFTGNAADRARMFGFF